MLILPPVSIEFLVVMVNVAVDYVKTVDGEKETEQLVKVSGVRLLMSAVCVVPPAENK